MRFWDAVMGDGVLLARQTGHEGGAGVLVMCSDPQNEVRKPQFLRHGERHTGGRHSERHSGRHGGRESGRDGEIETQ